MVKLTLYGVESSPPVRAVLLTLSALSLNYDFRFVNVLGGETMTSEFIELNPQHTVPVLDDDGKIFWDSHAINAYLVKKYAENDSLYPNNIDQCAMVDQRLHFDSGVLFAPLLNIVSCIFANETSVPQMNMDAINDGYNFMEAFLQYDYLVGNTMTIADFSAISTITSSIVFVPIDPTRTPKLVAWIDRMSKLPYYEKANAKGAEKFSANFKTKFEAMN